MPLILLWQQLTSFRGRTSTNKQKKKRGTDLEPFRWPTDRRRGTGLRLLDAAKAPRPSQPFKDP
jgi:hypothetical protein